MVAYSACTASLASDRTASAAASIAAAASCCDISQRSASACELDSDRGRSGEPTHTVDFVWKWLLMVVPMPELMVEVLAVELGSAASLLVLRRAQLCPNCSQDSFVYPIHTHSGIGDIR